jgi:hypothetical protein
VPYGITNLIINGTYIRRMKMDFEPSDVLTPYLGRHPSGGGHFRWQLLLRRARILDAEPTVSATQNRMRAWQDVGHVRACSMARDAFTNGERINH